MRTVRTAIAAAVLVAALGAVPASAGTTASTASLTIQDVEASPDGATTATLSIRGLPEGTSLDPGAIRIVENGQAVEGVEVGGVDDLGGAEVPAVAVAIDRSTSTEGEPIAAAKAAARELVIDLHEAGVLVAVVSFAADVRTEAPLASDLDTALAAIDEIEAGGATLLYDGIARSARIVASHDGPRDVVVFSDGEDSTSSTSLDDVRALVTDTGVGVTTVSLLAADTPDRQAILAPLATLADASGGQLIQVEEAGELESAFAAISSDLRRRIVVSWTAEPSTNPPEVLSIVATYEDGDVQASDGVQLPNPRLVAVTPPVPVVPPEPLLPALATPVGLLLSVVATALAVLLLTWLVVAAAGRRRREQQVDARLRTYAVSERETTGDGDRDTAGRSFGRRAAAAVDIIPRPTTFDERLARRLEQADWPMRVGEFILLVLGAGLTAALLLGLAAGARWWLLLAAALIGGAVPVVVLQVAVSRRQQAFSDQLPEVLQVIGGALRAGHAFSTAVDGAVQEVDEPARTELRRASVEARLGRPMDQALLGVSERMENVDLTWVVGALQVQREVGGNLAEVLANVANTLRARASVRRQVRALTAEGRLSAVIISVMPFVMFLALAAINPDYVALLFERTIGRVMVVVALVLLVAGILWLRQLIKPKF